MKIGSLLSCILFLIVTLGVNDLHAQEVTPPKNAFYAELGGNGLLFSANYDYRAGEKFGFRGGLGYLGIGSTGVVTIPLGINVLLGKDGKYFEMGVGATAVISDYDLYGTLSFSYRSQPLEGGVMWKAGITPFFNREDFVPFLGVAVGYCW